MNFNACGFSATIHEWYELKRSNGIPVKQNERNPQTTMNSCCRWTVLINQSEILASREPYWLFFIVKKPPKRRVVSALLLIDFAGHLDSSSRFGYLHFCRNFLFANFLTDQLFDLFDDVIPSALFTNVIYAELPGISARPANAMHIIFIQKIGTSN